MIEDNAQIKGYIESDKDLEIFFHFILSPFRIPASDKVRRKYMKVHNPLKIEQKKTILSNNKFIYVPAKHNPYFLRS